MSCSRGIVHRPCCGTGESQRGNVVRHGLVRKPVGDRLLGRDDRLVNSVGLTDAAIPWPIGERDGEEELVVFKALARAVRQESPRAVAAAWGCERRECRTLEIGCHQPRLRKKQTVTNPVPWKSADDELLCKASLAAAARLTGRTITAVRKRRRMLGLPDSRLASLKSARPESLEQQAAAACHVLQMRTESLSMALAELLVTFLSSKTTVAFWRSRKWQLSSEWFARTDGGRRANLSRATTFRSALRDRQSPRSCG
jgi:hypothetical protein